MSNQNKHSKKSPINRVEDAELRLSYDPDLNRSQVKQLGNVVAGSVLDITLPLPMESNVTALPQASEAPAPQHELAA